MCHHPCDQIYPFDHYCPKRYRYLAINITNYSLLQSTRYYMTIWMIAPNPLNTRYWDQLLTPGHRNQPSWYRVWMVQHGSWNRYRYQTNQYPWDLKLCCSQLIVNTKSTNQHQSKKRFFLLQLQFFLTQSTAIYGNLREVFTATSSFSLNQSTSV